MTAMTMGRSAAISPDGVYRYELGRRWTVGPMVLWVMLNPSTADGWEDDPTIRRVISFSRSWGFGAARVVNLFAFRATDPRALLSAADPVGPENDRTVQLAVWASALIVLAWGANPLAESRREFVREVTEGRTPVCLGRTRSGAPKHPLYVSGTARPIRYEL